jgi:hypothetical protein
MMDLLARRKFARGLGRWPMICKAAIFCQRWSGLLSISKNDAGQRKNFKNRQRHLSKVGTLQS